MNVGNNGAFNYRNHVRTNRDRTALDEKVRVVFYTRVSTQHEAQCNALENQIEWCMDLLEKHPFAVRTHRSYFHLLGVAYCGMLERN